ncbi:uncharacterized protein EI90DRAFT_3158695 [Cantharellus anzutake]|uniref:uncharacterized protein n=1 Tax=Cantharellus anzutake TaxID=1750568 RepID=UPI00190353DC|nr:uncharacterized protein EI90DRAFT_3158695 [Cantharellus anzutake]KAF8317767.1 hypothetical protein EI90DRAFT_3158695 [Cantharellus anzutake]
MEFQATKDEIDKIDQAIHQINVLEQDFLHRLSRIREERVALHAVRFLAVSTLAPIHRLPNELLEHIFVLGTYGLPLDEDCDAFAGLVCTVSKKWRDIAVGCPALWRRINVTCVTLATLALRLERSKSLGIDIYADWGHFHPSEEIEETMCMILPYMRRWSTFHINCFGLLPFREVLGVTSMLMGEASQLEHLCIITESHEVHYESPISISMAMPSLRTVEIEGIDIQWNCIEKASDVIISFALLPCHLLDFQSLRKLKLKGPRYPQSTIPPQSALPALQHLIVDKCILNDLLQISMPSLRMLQVLRGDTYSWERQKVQYPSLPSLRTFIYGSNHPSPTPFLLHVLGLMPMVTKIVFDGSVPSDAFFWSWATTHQELICPRLEELIFHNAFRDPTLSVNMFVQSRSGPKGKLPLPMRGWALNLDPSLRVFHECLSEGDDESESESDVSGGSDSSVAE